MNYNNDNLNRASGAHNILLSKRGMAAKAAAFLCILAAMVTICFVLLAANGEQVLAAESESEISSENVGTEGTISVQSDNGASVLDWAAINEVAEMIDALPNPTETDELDLEGKNEVYYALQDAYDAYEELSEEQQALINTGKFDALFDYFNGMISTASLDLPDGTISGGSSRYYTYTDPNGGAFYTHALGATGFVSTTDTVANYHSSSYANRILSLTTSDYSSTVGNVVRQYHTVANGISNVLTQNAYIMTEPTWTGHTFAGWAVSTTSAFSSWTQSTETGTAYIGSNSTAVSHYLAPSSMNSTTYTNLYARAMWNVTLTYSANGGNSAPSSTTIYYNLPATLSSTRPTRSGYTFLGWSTSSSATSASYSAGDTYTYQGSSTSVTLYAVWSENISTYTVTFNANTTDTVSNMPSSQTKYSNATLTLSTKVPTRTGYTFSGWNTTSGGTGNSYSAGGSYSTNANVTLYAQWTARSYTWTVWKDPNNTAWTYYYFVYNSTTWTRSNNSTVMSTAQIPTWGNYTFAGWYTSNYGNGTQIFNSSGAKNTNATSYWSSSKWVYTSTGTLYAKWTYKISYDANAGNDSVSGMPSSTTTKIYGKSATLSTATPTRTGYTFLGWSTSSSATSKSWDAGGAYNTDNNTPNSDGKVVLYAVWEANSSTVTFNLNDGTASTAIGTKKVTYGQSTNNSISTLSSSNVTREGYTLTGWGYKSASGTTLWDASGNYATTATSFWNSSGVWVADVGNFTAYAKWRANTYTVVYNANGGAGDMDSTDATYDEEFELAENEFYKEGYHFIGWSTSQTATTAQYTDQQTVKNLAGKLVDKDTITLYAVWEANSYTIVYDANGGTNAPANQTKYVDTNLVLRSKGSMTREGYTFVGWSTSEESTVTAYAGGGTMTNDLSITQGDSITLYAVWVREGANFNMTNVIDDTDMFAGDGNLRGGSGTTYSDSHIDSEYARVDGGKSSSTPGYFTGK